MLILNVVRFSHRSDSYLGAVVGTDGSSVGVEAFSHLAAALRVGRPSEDVANSLLVLCFLRFR